MFRPRSAILGLIALVIAGGASDLARSDGLEDSLREIQARRNLSMPESTILKDRKWSASAARASLRDYILARQALRRGRVVAALGLLTNAISRDPSNAAAWAELAQLRTRDKQYEQAMQAWSRVLAINPKDTDALLALGMQASVEGRMDEAARQLMAWRIGGGHRDFDREQPFQVLIARGALAETLEAVGEPDAASRARGEARDAIAQHGSGRYGFNPGLPQWVNFVTRLYQHRAYETAFDALETALQSDWIPEQYRADLTILAIGLAVLFDDGQAISRMFRTLETRERLDLSGSIPGPTSLEEALYETANIFSQMGNEAGAAWLYEDVIELDPRNVMARNNLGYYLLENNRLDPAVQRMIRSAWTAAPEDSAVLDSYGWMQYLLGRFEDDADGPGAVSLLRESHERAGAYPSAEVLDHLGDALYRIGDLAGAKRSWKESLAMVTQADIRESMISQLDQRQERLWGWWIGRIRNSRAVYDLRIQPLQRRLTDKLNALESNQVPPVRPTEAERVKQQLP